MANMDAVGAEGTPFRLDVERGKVHEFAKATYSTNADYLEREHPVSQPTFLTTTMHWQVGDNNPWSKVELNQQRGLHAEQEYTFFGPPPKAGTKLECRARVTEIFTKQGRRGGEMTFAVMVTDFLDEDGTLVAQAKMTGVETARAPEEEA